MDVVEALAGQRASRPVLVDVREDRERAHGFAPGSRHLPLGQLKQRLGELPSDRPVAFICQSGRRSAMAATAARRVEKEQGARGIFRSLNDKLMTLPDTVEVWPGHLGGSLCGGPGMDLKVSSTIGFERAGQPLLQIRDEDEFVERTTSALGPQPPNFQSIVALNRGPLVADTVDPGPLAPRQLLQAQAAGALVVDVRTERQFDEAHIPAPCASPRGGRDSAPSSVGWPAPLSRASSWAATTRTRSRPRSSPPPGVCARSPAPSKAA
jgi:rhodanese-related sulfurtransferase